jgi:sugar diacid utilization regulator
MVRCLVVIINPASEQTNLTVHVNTMVGRVFGIFSMEGLELMDLNRIRELYSAIMEYFNATQ